MTYISFCSGIEAATQAWHTLGWKPKAFCEIDKFPSRVLAHHYPDVPNLGDFTKVDWSQWSADVCVGGTPCQAFSVAGLRKSLQDERGNLSLEFIRAINIIRPRYVVWENVPGVLSTSDNAFGCFLAGLVGCDEPIVFESGWPNAGVVDGPDRRAAWRILDAQYFGLAQRRKRVFVVASSGDGPHPAEILFEWESMRRDSPPSREAGKELLPALMMALQAVSVQETARPLATNSSTKGRCFPSQPSPCASTPKAGGGRLDGESETIVTHSLRADGFDASEDGTGRGTPLVPVAIGFYGNDSGNDAVNGLGPTLRSMSGGGGNHPSVVHAMQAGALRENPDTGPDGVGVQEGIAYTIEARAEVQAVAFNLRGREGGAMPELSDIASLRAASGGSSRSYVTHNTHSSVTASTWFQGIINHGTKIKTDTASTLRNLRGEVGAEALAEWGFGVFDSLQQAEILQSEVHGGGVQRASFQSGGLGWSTLPLKEDMRAWSVREMRSAGRQRRTPHRWKLSQRISQQLGAYLSELSQQGASPESFMHDLREACEGSRVLQYAPFALEKTRGPAPPEGQPVCADQERNGTEPASDLQGDWLRKRLSRARLLWDARATVQEGQVAPVAGGQGSAMAVRRLTPL